MYMSVCVPVSVFDTHTHTILIIKWCTFFLPNLGWIEFVEQVFFLRLDAILVVNLLLFLSELFPHDQTGLQTNLETDAACRLWCSLATITQCQGKETTTSHTRVSFSFCPQGFGWHRSRIETLLKVLHNETELEPCGWEANLPHVSEWVSENQWFQYESLLWKTV